MAVLSHSGTNLIKQLAIRLSDKPAPDFIFGGDILADHQTVILFRSPSKSKAILSIDQSQQAALGEVAIFEWTDYLLKSPALQSVILPGSQVTRFDDGFYGFV